jgi:hypothetical protein
MIASALGERFFGPMRPLLQTRFSPGGSAIPFDQAIIYLTGILREYSVVVEKEERQAEYKVHNLT